MLHRVLHRVQDITRDQITGMGGICTVQVYQKSNNVNENGSQYVGDIMVQKVSSKHLSIIDLLTQMLSNIPFPNGEPLQGTRRAVAL